ncbi:MAG: hypothetical protein ACOYN2_04665, partial [Patescibacteria group bacterium]
AYGTAVLTVGESVNAKIEWKISRFLSETKVPIIRNFFSVHFSASTTKNTAKTIRGIFYDHGHFRE